MNLMNSFFFRCIALMVITGCFSFFQSNAQTPTDAIMMKPGAICLDANYEYSQWHEYWEGTLKRDNGNVGTLRRHSVTPMFNLGVLKWLNIMSSVHYKVTDPTAGQLEGAKGFSDFNIWAKAEVMRKQIGAGGTLTAFFTAGYMVPVSKYVADYPYSIGMGCTEGSLKGIMQYRHQKGFYVRIHAGYNLRGNANLQRSYYYTTQGYYGSGVDVPNAMDYSATAGYYTPNKQYKAELIFDGLYSFGGFDIRRQDMMFPSNKVEFMRLGARFDYYPSFAMGLNIHATGGYVLTGRNVGQSTLVGIGIGYVFKMWNTENKKESQLN